MEKKLEPLIASVLGAFFLLCGITQYLEAIRNIAFKSIFLTNSHYAFITGIFAIAGAMVMRRYSKIGGLMLFVSCYFSYLVSYWLIDFIPVSSLFQEFLMRLLMMLSFMIVGLSAIVKKPWTQWDYNLLNVCRLNANTFGSLASVIGGAIISASIGLFFQDVSMSILIFLLGLSLVSLLYGFGINSLMYQHCLRKIRKKKLKIGILSDIPHYEKDCWVKTNISSNDWEDELKKCGAKNTELITVLDNFDKYTAILNPYGGLYPERDLSNYETLNKILNYVKEGGFFINVADIPGYFACPLVKPWHKIEIALRNAPYAYKFIPNLSGLLRPVEKVPFFGDTPFTEKLGLRMHNTEPSYLFSRDVEFEDDLNKGIISEKMKDIFKTAVYSLSEKAVVTKEKDDKWIITDSEKSYIAKKEEGKLNIYGCLEFTNAYEYLSDFEIKKDLIKVHRAVIVERNIKSVIKPKEPQIFYGKVEATPLFFVEHGNSGKFLFSLIWINEQEDDVKEKLVTALAKLIVHAAQSK
ncbi:MAG: hypothetical protein KAT65_22200 [Methanophagales archaeon]|nr:hypothetical protein [Methanophagales archaeon]